MEQNEKETNENNDMKLMSTMTNVARRDIFIKHKSASALPCKTES